MSSKTTKEVLKKKDGKGGILQWFFAVSVALNLKVTHIAKSEFNREFTFTCICVVVGDHSGSSNCSDTFADSSGMFQMNVQFNLLNGGQKAQAQSIFIFYFNLRNCSLKRCCWPGAEQQNSSTRVRDARFYQQKKKKNLTLSMACWQSNKNITTSETQF